MKPTPTEALDWLFEKGCHTQKDGGTETCTYRAYETMETYAHDAPIEQARKDLSTSNGFIEFWLADVEFMFINLPPDNVDTGAPDRPQYRFSFFSPQFRPAPTQEAANDRARTAVGLVGAFADETNAYYAFGGRGAGSRDGDSEEAEQVLDGRVERLFWVNYWSPEIVSTLGRERVLNAPADVVTEAESGGVLLCPYLNPEQEDRVDRRERVERYFRTSGRDG